MTLCNPDGTPYKLKGEITAYDPKNPSIELFNKWDAEAIKIAGIPILYYEVFIQSNTLDPLYLEDRGKLFSPFPVQLYAFYTPLPTQNHQSEFGIDSLEEAEFQLNYADVLNRVGHIPKVGSRIFSPNRSQHWQIVQATLDDFQLWDKIRLKLYCAPFQESTTTGGGKVTKDRPDYEIN